MSKHSKRYSALREKIDSVKAYTLDEVVALIKGESALKFDAAVEIHFRTNIDVKQSDQQVRGTVSLPHGTGRKQKITAITANPADALAAGAATAGGEEIIKALRETGKIDFDVLVAEPAFMAKLAGVAKILGPRGLMPSPKNGTVAADLPKAIEELARGKVAFKNDNTGNVHLMAGRVSFSPEQLKENLQTVIDAIRAARPAAAKGAFLQSASVSTTMGPGIKIAL